MMNGDREEMEELSSEEILELTGRLAKLREEVEANIALAREESRPVDLGLSIGRLTRMDALQQQQMNAARQRRLENQLAQIKAAESRLSSGIYGECVRCELPIGAARLRARPEAPFCTRCQGAG